MAKEISKESEIKQIAMKLFFHHGYTKVTMSDVADAADISRPTLYKLFTNKEEIFTRIAIDEIASYQAKTSAKLKTAKSLREKLEVVVEIWVIQPYASVIDAKGGKDFLENCSAYVPETMIQIYTQLEAQLREILEPEMKGRSKVSARDLSHILSLAVKGLKASTPPLKDLKRMTSGLIEMVLNTVDQGI